MADDTKEVPQRVHYLGEVKMVLTRPDPKPKKEKEKHDV